MELIARHIVGLCQYPTEGDVDVSVDMEPVDKLGGGLGDLYCRVFLHFTVVPFVLELSVGFEHVVRRVLDHRSPFLVRGAGPDGPVGDHCSALRQCFS